MYKGHLFTDVTLHVPGMHNVKNALAATAAAICLGVRPNAVKYGLAGFNGAGRRFEFKGKYNGADVYDDYAHHPGELKALLDTVENLNYKRTVVVFQPHTYSRTAALFDDFVKQLRRPDVLLLAEIFAAREKNTIGISSAALADQIDGAVFCPTFDELEDTLRAIDTPHIKTDSSAHIFPESAEVLKAVLGRVQYSVSGAGVPEERHELSFVRAWQRICIPVTLDIALLQPRKCLSSAGVIIPLSPSRSVSPMPKQTMPLTPTLTHSLRAAQMFSSVSLMNGSTGESHTTVGMPRLCSSSSTSTRRFVVHTFGSTMRQEFFIGGRQRHLHDTF